MVYTPPRKMKLRITNGVALCEKKEAHIECAPHTTNLTSDATWRRIDPKLTRKLSDNSYGCQKKKDIAAQ
jgi:hypothetical protein